jgi:hypothetical protein
MSCSAAFRRAEGRRKLFRAASSAQRRTLAKLSKQAGVVLPEVHQKAEASKALDGLTRFLTQPQLDGFGDSTQGLSDIEREAA